MPDTIQKLDYLTMCLRGFDRRGAAAAFHSASASGFTVSGVWKESTDFAALVLYNAYDPLAAPGAARAGRSQQGLETYASSYLSTPSFTGGCHARRTR